MAIVKFPPRAKMVRYGIFSALFAVCVVLDYLQFIGAAGVDPWTTTLVEVLLIGVRTAIASSVALRTNGALLASNLVRLFIMWWPNSFIITSINDILTYLSPSTTTRLTDANVNEFLLQANIVLGVLGAFTPIMPAVSLAIIFGTLAYIFSIVAVAKSQLLDS